MHYESVGISNKMFGNYYIATRLKHDLRIMHPDGLPQPISINRGCITAQKLFEQIVDMVQGL